MNNVEFDLGGGILLSIADIIIPLVKGLFQDFVIQQV